MICDAGSSSSTLHRTGAGDWAEGTPAGCTGAGVALCEVLPEMSPSIDSTSLFSPVEIGGKEPPV